MRYLFVPILLIVLTGGHKHVHLNVQPQPQHVVITEPMDIQPALGYNVYQSTYNPQAQ
jgi:hypothetical protein